jgi:hypothetical protein
LSASTNQHLRTCRGGAPRTKPCTNRDGDVQRTMARLGLVTGAACCVLDGLLSLGGPALSCGGGDGRAPRVAGAAVQVSEHHLPFDISHECKRSRAGAGRRIAGPIHGPDTGRTRGRRTRSEAQRG